MQQVLGEHCVVTSVCIDLISKTLDYPSTISAYKLEIKFTYQRWILQFGPCLSPYSI